jgi:hypothetical protein
MRSLFTLMLANGCLLASLTAGLAADTDAAKAIIDAAIQAHGGPTRLAKTALMTRQAKGSMSFSGQEVPFTDELVLQLPQRLRWTLEAGNAGQKTRLLLVVNGDKGWQAAGGAVMDLNKQKLDELREEAYVLWLSTLLPLIKDNGFSTAAIPADTTVEGQPAAGILVAHKARPDLKLYFDKQSGLLVKISRRAKLADLIVEKDYLIQCAPLLRGGAIANQVCRVSQRQKTRQRERDLLPVPPLGGRAYVCSTLIAGAAQGIMLVPLPGLLLLSGTGVAFFPGVDPSG